MAKRRLNNGSNKYRNSTREQYVGVNESDLFLDSEATSVATNTGIVERSIVGVNDGGDLFLDSEATSVVNNTGIVERPITGVNDGGDLFLDESTSVVNNTGIVERPITGS